MDLLVYRYLFIILLCKLHFIEGGDIGGDHADLDMTFGLVIHIFHAKLYCSLLKGLGLAVIILRDLEMTVRLDRLLLYFIPKYSLL